MASGVDWPAWKGVEAAVGRAEFDKRLRWGGKARDIPVELKLVGKVPARGRRVVDEVVVV